MASWELQLISAIIRGGEECEERLRSAKEFGVDTGYFTDPTCISAWAQINDHYNRIDNWGHVPSEQLFMEWEVIDELVTPTENFTDICDQVRRRYLRKRGISLAEEFHEEASGGDPRAALVDLRTKVGNLLATAHSQKDVLFKEVGRAQAREQLDVAEKNKGLTGLPWPWMPMNLDTGGIHAGDYIMAWAIPKTGKTWFGLVVAVHLFIKGMRVLIYSKEMMWRDVLRRICCILAGVSYEGLKKGSLTPGERVRFMQATDKYTAGEFPGQIIFTTADRADGSTGGPAEIREKVDQHQPDFVFLDSAYMLEMPNQKGNPLDWKNLSVVNRELKQIFKTTGIPGLALFQENEVQGFKYAKSRGTASLAMNKGAVMDCDLGMKLVLNTKKHELSIVYAAAREVTSKGFTINAKWCEDVSYSGRHLHELGDDYAEDKKKSEVEKPRPTRTAKAMSPALKAVMEKAQPPVEKKTVNDEMEELDRDAKPE